MFANRTVASFVGDVIWAIGTVVVATIIINSYKIAKRKIRRPKLEVVS